jgi:hypothetical protein
MILDPVLPPPWIAALAALAAALTLWFHPRSARRLGALKSGFLTTVRLLALLGITALLLQPSREDSVPLPSRNRSLLVAVDTSASMQESHDSGASRIDAARADLEAAGLLTDDHPSLRFFAFDETARRTTAEALRRSPADGETTRFDTAVAALLRHAGGPPPTALIMLSDGHDFDRIAPGETARRARARDLPIHTMAYGTLDAARDISIRIANYHPQTFIRQKTRIEASVRTVGAPHETLQIDVLTGDEVVATKTLDTGLSSYHQVAHEVAHDEPGQYEYRFRVRPLANEREVSNNVATTFLNVISERLRILEIEGKPYWDTTFLRRSFARNDKFDIDSLVAFTDARVRPIRSNPERAADELGPPTGVADLMPYDLVILGREVERVIGIDGIRAIEDWVRDENGAVVFARGEAWSADVAADLVPVDWDTGGARGVRLEVTPQAGNVPAFQLLREVAMTEDFPEVIAFPTDAGPKTLASTFSVAEDQAPAIVYRRHGSGQTLSLGVGNLWRWVFNPRATYDNNAYDRFWDQLVLWLLANRGVTPIDGYSLRADTANLPLGETIRTRLGVHGREPPTAPLALRIFKDDTEVSSLTLAADGDPARLSADFTPREPGRYLARVEPPDAEPLETRFIVFREQSETTETAMDLIYLEELAKASGGRLIDAANLADLAAELLRETADQEPLTRRVPIWDRASIFAILCFLLALDWYYRRRWGLV